MVACALPQPRHDAAHQAGERAPLRAIDVFSCIGCHAIGLHDAGGFETIGFIEINPFRRAVLRRRFPGVSVHDDIRTYVHRGEGAHVVVGGPPCQATSVAAAVHGRRTGASLWHEMLRLGLDLGVDWFVVEQPPGNAAWEDQVADGLCQSGYHAARVEFSAADCGAPYSRRRVFIIACAYLSRLEIAWAAIPREIERAKGAALARGDWDPDQLLAIRVDARSAGEMDRSESATRRARIEALGDSNPPVMMTVIGRAILLSHLSDTAAAHAARRVDGCSSGGDAHQLAPSTALRMDREEEHCRGKEGHFRD